MLCYVEVFYKTGMLTRPDILRPEVQGQDQRDRGQRFEAKAENEAQIVCKNITVQL